MKLYLRFRYLYENYDHFTKKIMRVITLHKIDETESSDFEYASIYLGPPLIEKNKTSVQ